MGTHTALIQAAIDAGKHDDARRKIHEFQNLTLERIKAEGHDKRSAQTLLNIPQRFFARILKKEGKHKTELFHLLYGAAFDQRDLKSYPKELGRCFRGCKFKETPIEAALELYRTSKGAPNATAIRTEIDSWT